MVRSMVACGQEQGVREAWERKIKKMHKKIGKKELFFLGCDGFTNMYIFQYQSIHFKYVAFIGFQFYHNEAIISKNKDIMR